MGLKVWLPLNGNLENQGVSAVTATNNGAIVNTAGKIGSCYSFDGTDDFLTLNNFNPNGWPEISISAWVYPTAAFDHLFLFRGSGAHRFKVNSSGVVFRDTNNSTLRTVALGQTISTNVWTHITCVYKCGEIWIYQNGTQTAHSSTYYNATSTLLNDLNEYRIARTQSSSGNGYYTGKINDFRIYNHALSAAEVHEISQGLVLHYKLDGFNNASVLPPQYQQLEYIESSGTSYFDTGYKFNAETDSCKVIFKSNNTSHNGMILASSTKPYFWFYYYGSNGIRVYADNGNGQQGINGANNNLNDHIMEFKNKTYYLDGASKGSLSNTYADTANNLWLFSYGGSSYPFQGRIYYTEIKKNNDYKRIFIPAKRLTDSVAGMYDLITNTFYVSSNAAFTAGTAVGTLAIQDSSGYGHNGTILGSPTISSDTARYTFSTSFPTDADGILSTYPLKLWNNAFTYSFWIKPSGENGGRSVYAASYSGTTCSIEKTTGNKLRFYWNGSPDLSTSSLTITDGTWQHIAIVKEENKTTVKCYYNGVLKDTFTNTFSDKTFSGDLRIARDTRGNATSYTGMMSDFRIYCTALSAADIKQLYDMGAKVDNKQNLHTFELNESNSGRELLAVSLTTAYNSDIIRTNYDANGEITLTGKVSVGSNYIKINPVGKKYYFDADVTISAGNKFYIGFQRYDASKNSRSGDATMYMLNTQPSTDQVHKHYHLVWDTAVAISNQTTNFGYFDSNTPVDTIRLRILNDWNSPSNRTATIHSISLREVPSLQNTKINKKGQVITDELMEMNVYCRIQKNGIVETPQIIEI